MPMLDGGFCGQVAWCSVCAYETTHELWWEGPWSLRICHSDASTEGTLGRCPKHPRCQAIQSDDERRMGGGADAATRLALPEAILPAASVQSSGDSRAYT